MSNDGGIPMGGMNEYEVFYDRRSKLILANTTYEAQEKFAKDQRVPDKFKHMVSVRLVRRVDGTVVEHSPSEL